MPDNRTMAKAALTWRGAGLACGMGLHELRMAAGSYLAADGSGAWA